MVLCFAQARQNVTGVVRIRTPGVTVSYISKPPGIDWTTHTFPVYHEGHRAETGSIRGYIGLVLDG